MSWVRGLGILGLGVRLLGLGLRVWGLTSEGFGV